MLIADFFSQAIWLRVALAFAFFFALRGVLMTWVVDREAERRRAATSPWPLGRRPAPERLLALAEFIFQFWFNFVGGFVGWIVAWFLWQSPVADYGWRHLVAFIIAFAGVTGYLPFLSTGIRDALVGLAKRIGG